MMNKGHAATVAGGRCADVVTTRRKFIGCV